MAKSKKAKIKETPSGGYNAQIAAQPSKGYQPSYSVFPDVVSDLKVGWNFKRMDSGGKFKCNLKLLHSFEKKLLDYEGLTRKEIETKGHCHPLNINKISKDASARIEVMELDINTIHQLDLNTPARLWGLWEHNIFHVIWLDPKHEVYICK